MNLLTCNIDSRPKLRALFTVSGVLTDPTTLGFKIENPTGSAATYIYGTNAELIREATGIYYVNFVMNTSGSWAFKFSGQGACYAAGEAEVSVNASRF